MVEQLTLKQRLAAVLAADVVGYKSLMEHDTEGTVAASKNIGSGNGPENSNNES